MTEIHEMLKSLLASYATVILLMIMIKAESYKIFSKIYCPILPAPLELFFGDGYRSGNEDMLYFDFLIYLRVVS